MEINDNDQEKYLSKTNQSSNKSNKNVPFQEINQLLTTAKNIESDIERLTQVSFALYLLFLLLAFVFIIILNYLPYQNDGNTWVFIASLILFFASIILVTNTLRKILIKRNKEKRAFKKIVAIIQDTVPFYYKEMSVLEKANIETQIARLDIVSSSDN